MIHIVPTIIILAKIVLYTFLSARFSVKEHLVLNVCTNLKICYLQIDKEKKPELFACETWVLRHVTTFRSPNEPCCNTIFLLPNIWSVNRCHFTLLLPVISCDLPITSAKRLSCSGSELFEKRHS